MEMEKNLSILKACRFCPMCKHLCSSGNLTMHESDYPRGRGLIMYSIYRGEPLNKDYVNSLYNCFMCGSCLAGCEGDFDLPELLKSAREDIVSQGLEPETIKELKNNLLQNGNVYGTSHDKSFTLQNKKYENTDADVLYLAGQSVNYKHFEIAEAAVRFFNKTNTKFTTISDEPDCGKTLSLLGYKNEAKAAAKKLYEKISSLKARQLVSSDPMVIDCLLNDFKEFGLDLNSSTEILHFSEFAEIVSKKSGIAFKKLNSKITVADSEFLCKKNKRCDGAGNIIRKIAGQNFTDLYRSGEEAYATGEAAFYQNYKVFKDGKALGEKICDDAFKLGVKTIVTLSGAAKENILAAGDGRFEVLDIAEFVSASM
jgi:Fe-S oxidoreductase